jgi:GAF domain-containing protein
LYESLRREAANAKAWLEFADAMSAAGTLTEMASEAVTTIARLLEVEQSSLWLHEPQSGDFYCAASHGYEGTDAEPLAAARIPGVFADHYVEGRKTPFMLSAQEVGEQVFPHVESATLRPVVLAPLHPGYGVRGCFIVRVNGEGVDHFTDERMRLLDGLAYRASIALEKATLYHDQQESAHVANALLEFGRALAEGEELEEIYERIAERAAGMLGLERTSLWLQDPETGELAAVAVWGRAGEAREKILAQRYPAAIGERFADAPAPFVLTPEEYHDIPNGPAFGQGRHYAVAPFRFDGGRMGFLLAAADQFDGLQLKLLAGLADQAKLAIAGAR